MRLMPRTRFGVVWRGVVAFFVVVACAAGATATAGLLKVNDIVQKLDLTKPLATKQLVLPAPGQPETLLLVGVDHRYGEGSGPGNTDTMMLVRIDDSSATINTLSIPRDLGVQIPGVGYDKINAAYSNGGESLLIKTLRADVFPGLKVNHVLIVDFSSFSNLINAIGCVYAQVDHRYYNHSEGGLNPTTDYSSIDIQPGYQKMCGGSGSNLGGPNTALAFVRFRHNDSDFVRQARQQAFLRWAKQNFSSGDLLSKQNELTTDFGKDVQTDHYLHTTAGLIDLFNLAVNADGSAQKSIPFPSTGSAAGSTNLTFSQTATEQAYQQFMTPTNPPPGGSSTTTPTTSTTPATTGKHRHGKRHVRVYTPPSGMTPDPGDGNSQAAHLGNPGLPIYYPKDIPDNFVYCFSHHGELQHRLRGAGQSAGLCGVLSAPLRDHRLRRQAVPVIRDDAGGVVGRSVGHRHRRVRDHPGHHLARCRPCGGSADPAQPVSHEGRQRQAALRVFAGWSAVGGRVEDRPGACTGSPTRSRTTSRTTRWSRWPPRLTRAN